MQTRCSLVCLCRAVRASIIFFIEMSELFFFCVKIHCDPSSGQQWISCVASGTYWSRQESRVRWVCTLHTLTVILYDVATRNFIKYWIDTRFVAKFNTNGDTIVGVVHAIGSYFNGFDILQRNSSDSCLGFGFWSPIDIRLWLSRMRRLLLSQSLSHHITYCFRNRLKSFDCICEDSM